MKKNLLQKKSPKSRGKKGFVGKYPVIAQSLVILISLTVGVVVFMSINFILLPQSMPLPETTAINWFTLHKHSMTLDYLRFVLFVITLQCSMIMGWILFIWKKN